MKVSDNNGIVTNMVPKRLIGVGQTSDMTANFIMSFCSEELKHASHK